MREKSPVTYHLLAGMSVRMRRSFKSYCRGMAYKKGRYGLRQHVREFGRCTGLVIGPVDYNNCVSHDPNYDKSKVGPEVDVLWIPSGLRYAYNPKDLEIVR